METLRNRRLFHLAASVATIAFAAVALRLLFAPSDAPLAFETPESPSHGGESVDSREASPPVAGETTSPTTDLHESIEAGAGSDTSQREIAVAAEPARVVGRLIDADSRALPGADVMLFVMRDLGMRWSSKRVAAARSGNDGRFEIIVPAADDGESDLLYLAAWRTNELFHCQGIANVEAGETSDLTDVSLQEAASVAVRVVDANDSPIEGAFVVPAGLAALETVTSIDGIARFAAIPLGASQWSAGARGRAVRTGIRLGIESGRNNELTIGLAESAAIAGHVFDADGRPLGNLLLRAQGAARAVFSREDGSFAIDDVPSGPGLLEATLAGQPTALSIPFVAPDSSLEWRLPVRPIFTGSVVGASGALIEGAKLSLLRIDASKFRGAANPGVSIRLPTVGPIGAFRARTSTGDLALEPMNETPRNVIDAERSKNHVAKRAKAGEFVVYGAESQDAIFVVADSEEHGVAVAGPFALRANAHRAPVVVRLGGGARLLITVSCEGGEPVSAAKCKIANAYGLVKTTETDASGRATAGGLPVGAFSVVVTHPDFPLAAAGAFLPRDCTTEIKVELATSIAVEGRVLARDGEVIAGARVFVTKTIAEVEDSTSFVPRVPAAETMTDAAGNYRIDRAPPGDVTFEIVPNVTQVVLAQSSVVPVAPISVRLGTEAEQRLDLRTDWPGLIDLTLEFTIGGARVDLGAVEVHRLAPGYGNYVASRDLVDGRFAGTFVRDKEYRFAVRSRGDVWHFSDPVEVTRNTPSSLVVAIPATPVLTGRVEDERGAPIVGASVYLGWSEALLKPAHGGRAYSPSVDLDRDRWRSVTAGDGTFLLPPAQIGAHSLVVTAQGFEPIKVAIDDEVARRIPLRLPLKPKRSR